MGAGKRRLQRGAQGHLLVPLKGVGLSQRLDSLSWAIRCQRSLVAANTHSSLSHLLLLRGLLPLQRSWMLSHDKVGALNHVILPCSLLVLSWSCLQR